MDVFARTFATMKTRLRLLVPGLADGEGPPLAHTGYDSLNYWKGGDDTGLSLAAFANAVRLDQKTPRMVDHAYPSGVAALTGLQAMDERREVLWPGDYRT